MAKELSLEKFVAEILGQELPESLRKYAKRCGHNLPKKMTVESWWEVICVAGLVGGP